MRIKYMSTPGFRASDARKISVKGTAVSTTLTPVGSMTVVQYRDRVYTLEERNDFTRSVRKVRVVARGLAC